VLENKSVSRKGNVGDGKHNDAIIYSSQMIRVEVRYKKPVAGRMGKVVGSREKRRGTLGK